MYRLVYYVTETMRTEGNELPEVFENEYHSDEFRLRRNALHYLREIVKSEYREEGFGTEEIVGGIKCYKSEKTNNKKRKVIEIKIKVEKV